MGASTRGATTDDDIIKAIVDALKPWKPQRRQIERGSRAGHIEAKSKAEVLAELSKTIRGEIRRFRATVPNVFSRDAIRKTRDDARAIIKSIDDLQDQLSAKTLSPELGFRLGLSGSLSNPSADADVAPLPSWLAVMPLPRLFIALNDVRRLCKAAVDNQPQPDQVKLWCAQIALRLILEFSQEKPTAGSAGSKYCRIAGLLYQSVTGNNEQTLRHVCQDVLRPYAELLRS